MRDRGSDWSVPRLLLRLMATPVLLAACAQPAADAEGGEAAPAAGAAAERASAVLRDAQGTEVGTAAFTEQTGGGVLVEVHVTGITAGRHGVHIHEVGMCDAASSPTFSSAGGHFNPAGRQHGLENPQGPHAGDMPNLDVGADGSGHLTFTNPHITLGAGASSLFDTDGSAVVVHAQPDDQMTDPSGDSGDRVACGVIERG